MTKKTPPPPGADPAAPPRPNPEVVAKPRRRTFTADYKRRILDEADAAGFSGSVGALLRREGLYFSHLVTWRRQRDAGILEALTPHKRGPKSKRHPLEDENQELRRHNERLSEQLRKAEIIIFWVSPAASEAKRHVVTAGATVGVKRLL
jgi:transposase-like protein